MSWYAGHVIKDDPDLVSTLLDDGNDVNDKDTIFAGRTALHYAAGNGHTANLKILIARGGDVNAKDEKMETPLHRAALHGYAQAADALIQGGADLHAQTFCGYTPLHWAGDMGEVEAIHTLLHAGTAVNSLDYSGATPLHWAAKNGHKKAVELLLSHGADPSIADKGGLTPRDLIHDTVMKDKLGASTHTGCNCKAHPAFQVQRHTDEIDALLQKGEHTHAHQENGHTHTGACDHAH